MVINNLSNPFSIMMDESNDKVDKSCIITVGVLNQEAADIKLLDMPILIIVEQMITTSKP